MPLPLLKMIDIPPVWLLGFAIVLWWVDQLLSISTGLAVVSMLGTFLVVAGCALIVVAAAQFRTHKTTIIPHLSASSLITSGVFARSRNPIYLADAIILAGLSLRWDFWPGVLLVPVFMALIQKRFILEEESRLLRDFPAEFRKYASKTGRWM